MKIGNFEIAELTYPNNGQNDIRGAINHHRKHARNTNQMSEFKVTFHVGVMDFTYDLINAKNGHIDGVIIAHLDSAIDGHFVDDSGHYLMYSKYDAVTIQYK